MTVLAQTLSITQAPAKVNLTLHVGPPRADGRHPLRSLVVFARDASDRLVMESGGQGLSLDVDGPFAASIDGPAEDNLVLKAARALAAHVGREPEGRFILTKRLPVAAGIGGGSADAGAALRLCAMAWGVEDGGVLLDVACGLGGDVPAALLAGPCMMEGDGDRVSPLDGVPELYAVLCNPGLACPTGPVFAAYDARGPKDALGKGVPPPGPAKALINWLKAGRNDLEAAAVSLVPDIADVLGVLRKSEACELARMSGSGATCFGLFRTMEAAQDAADRIKGFSPSWWTMATRLGAG